MSASYLLEIEKVFTSKNRGCPFWDSLYVFRYHKSQIDPINRIWMIRSRGKSDSLPGR